MYAGVMLYRYGLPFPFHSGGAAGSIIIEEFSAEEEGTRGEKRSEKAAETCEFSQKPNHGIVTCSNT